MWNARNAREAVEVDRFRAAQVTQVGAPQLDVYFSGRPARSDREELGLDPRKKILVLATSSFTYDSDQTYLVDMLLDAIRGGEIRHPLQIVLRLHPDDRVGRYLKYRHAPEVILDIPERFLATLGWTMTQADLERMAALLRHADVMVNFATTVTLEAAIVDTPTLLVAFSPIDPDGDAALRGRPALQDALQGPGRARPGARGLESRRSSSDWINRYLDDPEPVPRAARDHRARVGPVHGRRARASDWATRSCATLARAAAAVPLGSRVRLSARRADRAGATPSRRRDAGRRGDPPGAPGRRASARPAFDAPLLATNTRVCRRRRGARRPPRRPFPLYRMARAGVRRAHGTSRGRWASSPRALHAHALARARPSGSRREVLRKPAVYRRFLGEVRPDVIHVQHPLERCLYARTVRRLEGWRMPLVVTAHSLSGEHDRRDHRLADGAEPARGRPGHRRQPAHRRAGDSLGRRAERVRVIRSGVDTEQFRPRDRRAARRGAGHSPTRRAAGAVRRQPRAAQAGRRAAARDGRVHARGARMPGCSSSARARARACRIRPRGWCA